MNTPQTPSPKARPGRKPGRVHDTRLNFRLRGDIKEKIERAAFEEGVSVSDFASRVLLREAEEVLERKHHTVLSERDWERFVELMRNPPPLSPTMIKALEHHQQHTRREGEDLIALPGYLENLPEELQSDPH